MTIYPAASGTVVQFSEIPRFFKGINAAMVIKDVGLNSEPAVLGIQCIIDFYSHVFFAICIHILQEKSSQCHDFQILVFQFIDQIVNRDLVVRRLSLQEAVSVIVIRSVSLHVYLQY